MKKNLFLAVAGILAAQIATAQTQKGTQTLGGNMYFTTRSYDNSYPVYNNPPAFQKNTNTTFTFGPAYSYFVADKLELSGTLQFSTSTDNTTYAYSYPYTNTKQTMKSFGGIVSLLKYCMFDKVGLRMGPYVGYSRGVVKATNTSTTTATITSTPTSTNNSDNYNAGVRMDIVYYPSKTLGLAANLVNLGYGKGKTRNPDDAQQYSNSEAFNANFISGLQLSVFYVIGNK